MSPAQTDQTIERKRGGRPRALRKEHVLALKEMAAEHPGATLDAITQMLAERCGVKVCILTVRKALRQAGVVRVKPLR
ncbi:MAG: hypothetical protein L6Q74_20590 [Sphaerotilus natans subsp. sulfidivorans]|uniref:hypothetical protein n=1 Tax=Sphaerotilus sulfidivorans TaxID=639200 RepID=UPI002354885C|nr:hypothetical protein [Sphaerotilus sulfidivorans]MCK6404275.1 hypothetical protein [Sphaerotilus sulfidivorans]